MKLKTEKHTEFVLIVERHPAFNGLTFEMTITAGDLEEPPFLCTDEAGDFYVQNGHMLSKPGNRYGYRYVPKSELVMLNSGIARTVRR